MDNKDILLRVENLKKDFFRIKGLTKRVIGVVKAVDEVNFLIRTGETLALVGESGSGKTTTGRCILRAIEPSSGKIYYNINSNDNPINMMDLNNIELKKIRKNMAMIFQDPFSSLNPRMTIFKIISEPLVIHKVAGSGRELENKVADLLKMVELDPIYMRRYPHAFSGGQRQRIAIARALSMSPKFIVADEPVSALDVSVQVQILNLLKDLQKKLGLTCLFIAHNLSVVEYVSNRVAVMYVGKILELAETRELFYNLKHPYTEALLSAIPKPDPKYKKRRIVLKGDIADPANPPPGCYFHPRCQYVQDICREHTPPLIDISTDEVNPHYVACHFYQTLTLTGVKK